MKFTKWLSIIFGILAVATPIVVLMGTFYIGSKHGSTSGIPFAFSIAFAPFIFVFGVVLGLILDFIAGNFKKIDSTQFKQMQNLSHNHTDSTQSKIESFKDETQRLNDISQYKLRGAGKRVGIIAACFAVIIIGIKVNLWLDIGELNTNAICNIQDKYPSYYGSINDDGKKALQNLLESPKFWERLKKDSTALQSSLFCAIETSNTRIVKKLIRIGADVNEKESSWYNYTPLIRSTDNGSYEIVKILLENGATKTINEIVSGDSALSNAVRNGNEKIVRLLVKNGADVNLGGKGNPLYLAKDKEIFNILLDSGAKVNDEIMENALKWELDLPLLKKFLKNGGKLDDNSLLIVARNEYIKAKDKFEILEYLLNRGLNPKVRGINEENLVQLFLYAFSSNFRSGDMKTLEMLIQRGVEINTQDKYNRTALNIAMQLNHKADFEKIEQILRKYGAKTSDELKNKGVE